MSKQRPARESPRRDHTVDLVRVVLIAPDQTPRSVLIRKDFRELQRAVGRGDIEFLGILSHENGLDELALVYCSDQNDAALAENIGGIRGAIVGIRCDDSGENISLFRDDANHIWDWLNRH